VQNLVLKVGLTMKSKLFKSEKIYIGQSQTHGYGVFCNQDIKKGELIEECYYLTPNESKWQDLDKTFLNYFFAIPYLQDDHAEFADKNGAVNIGHVTRPVCVLGSGMIFNHSKDANVDYTYFEPSQIFSYRANRSIKEGAELFIKYSEYSQF
jgi:SET domain-containing protein